MNVHGVTPLRFPEGIAAPDGNLGFVELRDGGVSAIDLSTGRDVWRIAMMARPLIVVGDRLVAEDRTESRDNVLRLVTLHLGRQGAVDRRLDPIPLPEWVAVGDPEQHFEYRVAAEDDTLIVDWDAASHYAGGAPPPPSIAAQADRRAHGRARVNLHTGRVQAEAIEPAARSGAIERSSGADRADTELAADPALPAGAHSRSVVGDRVFYLVEPASRSGGGPTLVSADLQTGLTVWERLLPARSARPPARRM